MFRNRLIDQVETVRLPQPPAQQPAPGAFMLVPVGASMIACLGVYQLAMQEAQAVAKPSLVERDLLGVWN
jgi:hypothetical protein